MDGSHLRQLNNDGSDRRQSTGRLHPGVPPGGAGGLLVDLGRAPYGEVLCLQRRLVRLRHENKVPDLLLLVEHEPVITLGLRAGPGNILANLQELACQGIEVYRVERGGDVTYHGPGQLVGYPVIDLATRKITLRTFVDLLEEVVICSLAEFGIAAGRRPQYRGVWVGKRKIAAIGIAVRRWVTFHGFALNISQEPRCFCSIRPCGLEPQQLISMADLLGGTPKGAEVRAAVRRSFVQLFPGHWQPLNSSPSHEKALMTLAGKRS